MARQRFVRIVWPPEVDELLGTMSDRELARHLNLDPDTVQQRRRELRIDAFRPGHRVLVIVCVVCGKKTPVVGRRLNQLRITCPPRRAGRVSVCQALLIGRSVLATSRSISRLRSNRC